MSEPVDYVAEPLPGHQINKCIRHEISEMGIGIARLNIR